MFGAGVVKKLQLFAEFRGKDRFTVLDPSNHAPGVARVLLAGGFIVNLASVVTGTAIVRLGETGGRDQRLDFFFFLFADFSPVLAAAGAWI